MRRDADAGDFLSIRERIRGQALRSPEKTALADDGGERRSYGELVERFDRFRAALARDGVRRGDVVATSARNSVRHAEAYLAAAAAGVAVAPLPLSATLDTLEGMIADCGARLLFVDAEEMERFSVLGPDIAVLPLDGLDDWLAGAPPVEAEKIDPGLTFNIIYSSGTTGSPKGIVHSHAMREVHVRLGEASNYDREAVTLVSTPLYSNTTLVSFLPTVALGGTALLMRKFSPEQFLRLAEEWRVTHAMLVPVQYQRLMDYPEFDRFDLGAFREKFCTSAPFSAELKREVIERFPGHLSEYYGMTEGGGLCILRADRHPDKLETVGQPATGSEVRLIDEDGREVGVGETGEVVGHAAIMMDGYLNLPDVTRQSFWTSPDGRRFMRTGDLGRFDEDGFLTLVGRKKDVIISGGFNIYPGDLEEIVGRHPDVRSVAVVGVPSREWGETPVAFVEAPTGDEEHIRAFANDQLGRTQRLARVIRIEELPRSSIGKILKRVLRDRYPEYAGE